MRGIANHFAVVLFVITACTGTKSGGSADPGATQLSTPTAAPPTTPAVATSARADSAIRVPSPDGRRLLVIPPDSGVDNSVEIWSISGGTRRLEWSTGDEEMRPIDGRWQDDSTVIYRVVPERQDARADTIRMQLPFRDGGWKIAGRVP